MFSLFHAHGMMNITSFHFTPELEKITIFIYLHVSVLNAGTQYKMETFLRTILISCQLTSKDGGQFEFSHVSREFSVKKCKMAEPERL